MNSTFDRTPACRIVLQPHDYPGSATGTGAVLPPSTKK